MKKYLNFDALSYFLDKLSEKFVSKEEVEAITDEQIEAICGGEIILLAEEVEL